MGCFAAIADACMRVAASDIPSLLSAHYSGDAPGPCQPFGFDMYDFENLSQTLRFDAPELCTCRTQVLDYFDAMHDVIQPDHLIFQFEKEMKFNDADRMMIDNLCVNVGFPRTGNGLIVDLNAYLTNQLTEVLDNYPELATFRDTVFLFKMLMVLRASLSCPLLDPLSHQCLA